MPEHPQTNGSTKDGLTPTPAPGTRELPRTRELLQRLRAGRAINRWLLLRIALPFPLSWAILAGSSLLVTAPPPTPLEPWTRLCAAGGIVVGLCAMVGLLLARSEPARRLTLWLAGAAATLLVASYLLAADPFCWGTHLEGDCASR